MKLEEQSWNTSNNNMKGSQLMTLRMHVIELKIIMEADTDA